MQQSDPIESLKSLLSRALSLANSPLISLIEKDMIMALIRKAYDEASLLETNSVVLPEEPSKLFAEPIIVAEPSPILTPEPIIAPEIAVAPVSLEIVEEPVVIPPSPVAIEDAKTVADESVPVTNMEVEFVAPISVEEKHTPAPSFAELVEKVKPKEVIMPAQEPDDKDDEPMFFSDIRLEDMFDPKASAELSERLSASRIDDIVSAIGLNERIFTVNELFGGNNDKFKEVCDHLKDLGTFNQAKSYLSATVIEKYNWMAPDKFRKAKEFIKLARRLYI